MSIRAQRQIIQHLIEDNSIVDAPTAYYALYYDERRSTLVTSKRPSGRPQGFAGRFQTGIDLFRPLVTMRCNTAEVAADLLAEMLTPDRPYLFFSNANQLPFLGGSFQVDTERILNVYYLDNRRFRPSINVMVQEKPTPDGLPRFEIHSAGLMAAAGINWMSPGFAEMYVHVEPLARKRGWGRACVVACTEHVIRGGRMPLYLVEPENEASVQLAESVGYVDSGARQVYAEGVYLGHPAQRPATLDDSPLNDTLDSALDNGAEEPASQR